jgi:hypothetical protein
VRTGFAWGSLQRGQIAVVLALSGVDWNFSPQDEQTISAMISAPILL